MVRNNLQNNWRRAKILQESNDKFFAKKERQVARMPEPKSYSELHKLLGYLSELQPIGDFEMGYLRCLIMVGNYRHLFKGEKDNRPKHLHKTTIRLG